MSGQGVENGLGDPDALTRAKDAAEWDASRTFGTSHNPDVRTIPFLLAGILDALIAVAERLPSPPALADDPWSPSALPAGAGPGECGHAVGILCPDCCATPPGETP